MRYTRLLGALGLAFFGLSLSTCASSGDGPPVRSFTSIAPDFDYVLPDELRGGAGSAGITIVLLEPRIAERTTWLRAQAQWASVPQNMAADLQEMLIARGFVLQGPYRTRDEVIYPERRGSDFFLESEIDLGFQLYDLSMAEWRECSGVICIGDSDPDLKTNRYIDSGVVSLTGRIDFTLVETITGNTLWRRSYDIPGDRYEFEGNPEVAYATATTVQELANAGDPGIARLVEAEPGLANAVTQALTSLYSDVLNEAARQLDPQGLQREKAIADSLKIGRP